LLTHHHQPLPRSKHEMEGGFFCRHTTNPSLARIARQRGVSFVDTPPTPPLLELQDRGVLSVDTSLPRSKREMEGGFFLSTHHHQPLPRSNCEMEGGFFCRHTTNPSLARIARRRGSLCRHTPPSLETRDGGGVFLSTHHHQPVRVTIRSGAGVSRKYKI
jgi:hypothetical protein